MQLFYIWCMIISQMCFGPVTRKDGSKTCVLSIRRLLVTLTGFHMTRATDVPFGHTGFIHEEDAAFSSSFLGNDFKDDFVVK